MDPVRIIRDAQKLLAQKQEEVETLTNLLQYAGALNAELAKHMPGSGSASGSGSGPAPAPAPVPAPAPAPAD